MALPVGLAMYTVRDALAADLPGTCRAVADIGYTHAEVGPFGGHTTDDVVKACQDAGLSVVASHEMGLLGPEAPAVIEMLADLGVPYAVQPWSNEADRTAEGYIATARRLASLSTEKVTTLYHNHGFEFADLGGGRTGWGTMFEESNVLGELDSCWAELAGCDAAALLRALAGRVPIVHLKDCSDFERKTLCEIGSGGMPVAAIARAAEESGAAYLLVEQDDNWIDGDPVKSARLSFEALGKMLP